MNINKKKRIILVSTFILVFALLATLGIKLTKRNTQDGFKNFSIEIISERDGFSEIVEYGSEEEYLGTFIRDLDYVVWEDSEYGTYIRGFYDMQDNIEEQYWWCITVNDEANTLGVDLLPIEEGSKYTFTLTRGW